MMLGHMYALPVIRMDKLNQEKLFLMYKVCIHVHLFHYITRTVLCSTVKCPVNISIDNGYVELNENDTSVIYRCAYGYKLVGSASALCKEDGVWSSPLPKCIGMINT